MSAVDVRSDKLGRLVDENVEVKQLGTGFTFTEGPVWNPQGQFLLFSDMPADTRRRWDEQGGVEVVASPSNKGNGMTLDADGRLIVCEHSTSSLVRMDPDGKDTGREVLASHYEGKELNSPNDVVRPARTGRSGSPTRWYGRMPGFGLERERVLDWQGVFRVPPGGGDPELVVDRTSTSSRTGSASRPTSRCSTSTTRRRRGSSVYDVESDGTLSNGRMFFEGIGSGVIEEGIPDGMKCDERGNIWVTGPGGVWVISADGEHLGVIEIPENAGNLALGRPGLEAPCSSRARPRCTRSRPRSARGASRT